MDSAVKASEQGYLTLGSLKHAILSSPIPRLTFI